MDDKKISRRTFIKKAMQWSIGAIAALFSGRFYIQNIEPRWIEITRISITHAMIPPSFNGFKIIQFSDTHLGFHFHSHHLEKVIRFIQDEDPDMIIFSGDLIDNLLTFMEIEDTIILLNKLNAPYGKFAVYGNHDHGGYGSEKYLQIMEASGFTLLINDSIPIYNQDKDWITLSGLDDWLLGQPDVKKALGNLTSETFNILISHAPDTADFTSNYPVHLQLSGHTHGGQVQLPFIGPLITPPMGKKYTDGLYTLDNDLLLYVNRGLGTTRLPYRLFSRPEITVFTLQHERK